MASRLCLIFTALAVLAPSITGGTTAPSYQTFVDTFEDKPASLPAGLGSPVGIENGLFYNSWQVGTAQPSLTSPGNYSFGGVQPKSNPNVAVTASPAQVINGTVAITANYAGSKVKKFDLFETYLGCSVLTDNSLVGVASGCVLSVSGYYPDGSMIPGYSMSFGVPLVDTSTITPLPMQRILFPVSFLQVKTVTMQIAAYGGPNSELAVWFLDNVKHTNYYS